jgi:hypothetical protein
VALVQVEQAAPEPVEPEQVGPEPVEPEPVERVRPEALRALRPPGMGPGLGTAPLAWSPPFPSGTRRYLRPDRWPWFIPPDRSVIIAPQTAS